MAPPWPPPREPASRKTSLGQPWQHKAWPFASPCNSGGKSAPQKNHHGIHSPIRTCAPALNAHRQSGARSGTHKVRPRSEQRRRLKEASVFAWSVAARGSGLPERTAPPYFWAGHTPEAQRTYIRCEQVCTECSGMAYLAVPGIGSIRRALSLQLPRHADRFGIRFPRDD